MEVLPEFPSDAVGFARQYIEVDDNAVTEAHCEKRGYDNAEYDRTLYFVMRKYGYSNERHERDQRRFSGGRGERQKAEPNAVFGNTAPLNELIAPIGKLNKIDLSKTVGNYKSRVLETYKRDKQTYAYGYRNADTCGYGLEYLFADTYEPTRFFISPARHYGEDEEQKSAYEHHQHRRSEREMESARSRAGNYTAERRIESHAGSLRERQSGKQRHEQRAE